MYNAAARLLRISLLCVLQGRTIRVNEAQPPGERSGGFGGGRGRGYGGGGYGGGRGGYGGGESPAHNCAHYTELGCQ